MNCVVIIMAGGNGKRFGEGKVKVLQEIDNKPILAHLVNQVSNLKIKKIIIIVGIYKNIIIETLSQYCNINNITFIEQLNPQGTGHALQCCMHELEILGHSKVLILSGDTPLVTSETMYNLINRPSDALIMTRYSTNQNGCGRIITCDSKFIKIIEEKDASEEEKKITNINCGIYCIKANLLAYNLPFLNKNNVQQEYYITDVIKLIQQNNNIDIDMFEIPNYRVHEIMGVNTPDDLELLKLIYSSASGKYNAI